MRYIDISIAQLLHAVKRAGVILVLLFVSTAVLLAAEFALICGIVLALK
jgi:hypothetical protein